MAKQRKPEQLIESNPLVDGDQLKEAQEALEALNRTPTGLLRRTQRGVESPFARRRTLVDEDAEPAAVRLARQ